jgi:hypothetical protein
MEAVILFITGLISILFLCNLICATVVNLNHKLLLSWIYWVAALFSYKFTLVFALFDPMEVLQVFFSKLVYSPLLGKDSVEQVSKYYRFLINVGNFNQWWKY